MILIFRKTKFPSNSYILKGFGVINLFNVTTEKMLSSIKANLLVSCLDLLTKLQDNLKDFNDKKHHI